MNFKSKEKEFDTVKMMREIRDSLSRLYNEHPEIEEKELEKIRKRYGIKPQKKAQVKYIV